MADFFELSKQTAEIPKQESSPTDGFASGFDPYDIAAAPAPAEEPSSDSDIENKDSEAIKERNTESEGQENNLPIEESPEIYLKEQEETQDIKYIKALRAESTYDIPLDAKIPVKIDGEEQEIELSELRNNYSGKIAYDKKFTELDKERKQYQSDFNSILDTVNQFSQISKENPAKGLEFLAQQSGLDPLEYKRHLRNTLLQEYAGYYNMSDEEKAVYDQKEELEYIKSQNAAYQSRMQAEQAQRELQQTYKILGEQYGVDENRRAQIDELYAQQNLGTPSPQQYVEAHQILSRQERTDSIISKVDESLLQNPNVLEAVDHIQMANPDLTDEELIERVRLAYGGKTVKARKEAKKKDAKPKQQSKIKHGVKQTNNFYNKPDFYNL